MEEIGADATPVGRGIGRVVGEGRPARPDPAGARSERPEERAAWLLRQGQGQERARNRAWRGPPGRRGRGRKGSPELGVAAEEVGNGGRPTMVAAAAGKGRPTTSSYACAAASATPEQEGARRRGRAR